MGSALQTNAELEPAAVMLRTDGSVSVVQERETCEAVLGTDRVLSVSVVEWVADNRSNGGISTRQSI